MSGQVWCGPGAAPTALAGTGGSPPWLCVGTVRLELTSSWPQTRRAANCATFRNKRRRAPGPSETQDLSAAVGPVAFGGA